MKTRVVEVEVGVDSFLQLLHVLVAFEVDVLVLEASSETLNPDVVQGPVLSVHADLDVIVFKNFYEHVRCNLTPLIRGEGLQGSRIPRLFLPEGSRP